MLLFYLKYCIHRQKVTDDLPFIIQLYINIDPPYNTGNDFVYRDDYSVSAMENDKNEGNIDEEGNRLIKNQAGSGRFHSNWLNMIYPRLKISKDLLTDDGVIFISIDDNEIDNLKKICNEIFEEKNHIGTFTRVTKKAGKSTDAIAKNHDYIVVYSKSEKYIVYPFEHDDDGFKFSDEYVHQRGRYKLNQTLDYNTLGYISSLDYPIEIDGEVFYAGNATKEQYEKRKKNNPKDDYRWRWSKELFDFGYKNGFIVVKKYENNYSRIYTKTYQNATIGKDHNGNYYIEYKSRTKPLSTLEFLENEYSNDNSRKNLNNIFNKNVFEYSKPVMLIKILSKFTTSGNDIILDFFSGSATTAHAVIQLNAEDGGNRKFIMVQIPEPCDEKSEAYKAGYKNICEIGKERIRRAGEKIKEEFKDKEGIEKLDVGFKVFRVADTNIRWNSEALKEGQITMDEASIKNKDLIDFNPGFTDIDVVYEIMLRHRDFPLTSKIERLSNIGERTYIFADAVVVCLEEKVTNQIVDGIAAIEPKPIKVIFRDSAFDDDISLKLNTMNRLDAQLKKHNQGKEQSYRVEFI